MTTDEETTRSRQDAPREGEVLLEGYEVELVKKGGFAYVCMCAGPDDKAFAIKIPFSADIYSRALEQEIEIAREMQERPAPGMDVFPRFVRADEYRGQPCLIREWVPGLTLQTFCQRVREGKIELPPLKLVLEWYGRLARGLGALHALNYVHRDISDVNIVLPTPLESGWSERYHWPPFLIDYGAAGVLATNTDPGMTYVPHNAPFRPPEWAAEAPRAKVNKPTYDVYSLSVTLHLLLTLRLPHERLPEQKVLVNYARSADYDEAVEQKLYRVIRRGLSTEPAERQASMAIFAEELEACLAPPRAAVSRRRRAYTGLALIAGAALVLVAASSLRAPAEQVVTTVRALSRPGASAEQLVTTSTRLASASAVGTPRNALFEGVGYRRLITRGKTQKDLLMRALSDLREQVQSLVNEPALELEVLEATFSSSRRAPRAIEELLRKARESSQTSAADRGTGLPINALFVVNSLGIMRAHVPEPEAVSKYFGDRHFFRIHLPSTHAGRAALPWQDDPEDDVPPNFAYAAAYQSVRGNKQLDQPLSFALRSNDGSLYGVLVASVESASFKALLSKVAGKTLLITAGDPSRRGSQGLNIAGALRPLIFSHPEYPDKDPLPSPYTFDDHWSSCPGNAFEGTEGDYVPAEYFCRGDFIDPVTGAAPAPAVFVRLPRPFPMGLIVVDVVEGAAPSP